MVTNYQKSYHEAKTFNIIKVPGSCFMFNFNHSTIIKVPAKKEKKNWQDKGDQNESILL
jgi:hypothetical protein